MTTQIQDMSYQKVAAGKTDYKCSLPSIQIRLPLSQFLEKKSHENSWFKMDKSPFLDTFSTIYFLYLSYATDVTASRPKVKIKMLGYFTQNTSFSTVFAPSRTNKSPSA